MKGALLLLASLLATAVARADFAAPFTAPPFKLDASIIGLEGWEMRMAGSADDGLSARLVAVRWDENRTALLLDGASIKNAFPETTSPKVRVTARLAITFPSIGPKLQQIRFLIGGAPFGEIVFEGSPEGGLGFGNGTGRNTRVAVPVAQLKPNSYYTITILVNFDQSTYDVSITGVNRDGAPLTHEEKNVAFEGKSSALKGVTIISSTNVRAYLQQFLVESL